MCAARDSSCPPLPARLHRRHMRNGQRARARLGRAAGARDHVDLHWLVGNQLHALRGARKAQQVLPHREAGGVLRARARLPQVRPALTAPLSAAQSPRSPRSCNAVL